ncbi:hypothetical protein CGLO_17467 [Colletotrichum gloeosporioides Cg-14]|uniref:AAA+ ATPase domain-containing protein n=1 Tax=Colletotrichum gloeosporioides (strain Cg-14) TaxID=1237896 RepID=T0JTL3_COLGC|nr:hypothetical protein CGLO_17467 [Colletotrichum gloeosporioides Cg-14]
MSEKAAATESDSDVPDTVSLPDNSKLRKRRPSRSRRRRRSSYGTRYTTDSESDYDDVSIEDISLLERPLTSGVRYYNYEGFQNRMRTDEGDFGIEVFVAKPGWYHEMMAEDDKRDSPLPPPPHHARRRSSRRQTPRQVHPPRMPPPPPPPPPPAPSQQPSTSGPRPLPPYIPPVPLRSVHFLRAGPPDQRIDGHKHAYTSRLQLSPGSATAPEGRIMRIRLRSQVVLRALSSVAGYDVLGREKIVEFHRPFRVLEESLAGMKSKLSEMEKAMDKPIPAGTHAAAKDFILSEEQNIDPHDKGASHPPTDLINASTEIPEEKNTCGVSSILWNKSSFPSGTIFEAPSFKIANGEDEEAPTSICGPEDKSEFTQWSLYSFDYDGERLVPIWTTVRFKRFTGERDITSLECYPLSLHESNKDVFDEQKACGELFLKCIRSSTKHHYYSGWTFITGLFGETFRDHEGEEVQFPEHMESEIVVDFKETLQSYPGWETMSGVPLHFPAPWESAPFAEIPLKIWEEGVKAFPQHRLSYNVTTSIIIEEQKLYRSESSTWLSQDPFLDRKANWQEWTWSDEDLVLLPRRAFAYILRERKFTRIDVRSIEFNTEQGNLTLDQIQMKPERRRMIRSAVAAHFRGKQGPSTSDLDPVRGKGKGLVILLHGAPGVGKTATAEAVAAETERPLFPITCGDLGFSPAAVERSLKDIFRYAHLWNCILLFDEADVFLTQRERGGGNLERNALVGVFLRVLEYYSGILFLTTNRVGALDEGFRSRLHLSLWYPNLSLDDTIKILEANLNRLPRVERAEDGVSRDGYLKVNDNAIIDFVSAQYVEYSRTKRKKRGPWNGRQIRNAVQIAAGLALYDKQIEIKEKGEDDIPAFLTAEHFRAVAATTSEFEEYLKEVKVGDQEDQTKRRQERDARRWPDIGTLQEILYFLPRGLGKTQGHDIPTYSIELNLQIEDARTTWAEDVEQAESSSAHGEAACLDWLRMTTKKMTMTWKTTICEISMTTKKNRTSIPMSGGALREEEQGQADNVCDKYLQ